MTKPPTTHIRVTKTVKTELTEIADNHGLTVVELVSDLLHRSKYFRARGSG